MSRTRLIGVGLVSSLSQIGKKNSGLFRFFDFAGNNIITEPEWIRGLSLFVRGKFEERLQIVWTVGHYFILMVSSLSLPPYSLLYFFAISSCIISHSCNSSSISLLISPSTFLLLYVSLLPLFLFYLFLL